jgi:hypothetical protein
MFSGLFEALGKVGVHRSSWPRANSRSIWPIGNYANDIAAAAGGVPIGGIYRNGSGLRISRGEVEGALAIRQRQRRYDGDLFWRSPALVRATHKRRGSTSN